MNIKTAWRVWNLDKDGRRLDDVAGVFSKLPDAEKYHKKHPKTSIEEVQGYSDGPAFFVIESGPYYLDQELMQAKGFTRPPKLPDTNTVFKILKAHSAMIKSGRGDDLS